MSYKDRNKYKAWYETHKDEIKANTKAWREAHKEQHKASMKAWQTINKERYKDYQKAYREAHKEHYKEYHRADVNALGQTKQSIRLKSQRYLKKYGNKIPDYQIHHCCSYTEPYKFIYCTKEMHRLIHSYLRQHNIDADSDHYKYIKHLLNDTTIKYNLD